MGEIILVVIGIFIALQINNWNENRKLKLKEKILLIEFLNSIEGDLSASENWYKPRLTRKKEAIDSLFHYIKTQKSLSDSLFIAFYRNLYSLPNLRFDDGPFRNLESFGLELISNDSLRKSINRAYAISLPAFKNFADESSNNHKDEISERDRRIMTLKYKYINDSIQGFLLVPKVNNIINNQDFYWIFKF